MASKRRNGAKVRLVPKTGDATPASAIQDMATAAGDLVESVTTGAATAAMVAQALPEELARVATQALPPASNGTPPPTSTPAADPRVTIQVEDLAARALVEGQASMRAAQNEMRTWPPSAPGLVVLSFLPLDWQDDEARAFLATLNDDQAALVGAWMSRQFWDGYGLGQTDARQGTDLRVPT